MTARTQTPIPGHVGHESGTLRPPVRPGDHVQGRDDAPVTLVEFGDYQCPYCGMAYPIIKTLQRELGDSLRFVFRNFPLSELHPHAEHAAEAAESVDAQVGPAGYWTMHDELFERQQEWVNAADERRLSEYAARAGADASRVEREVADGTREQRVRDDFMSGVRSGVNGTPTFFINGDRFDGDWTNIEEFRGALRRAAIQIAV